MVRAVAAVCASSRSAHAGRRRGEPRRELLPALRDHRAAECAAGHRRRCAGGADALDRRIQPDVDAAYARYQDAAGRPRRHLRVAAHRDRQRLHDSVFHHDDAAAGRDAMARRRCDRPAQRADKTRVACARLVDSKPLRRPTTRHETRSRSHHAHAMRQDVSRHARARTARSADRRRRNAGAARAVRLRQDHHAAHDRRPRNARRRRPHCLRRRRRHRAADREAPGRHGVPELRAVSEPDRARQHRLWTENQTRAG